MGRKPRPTAVNEAAGTYVKDPKRRPVNEPQPVSGRPDLPAQWKSDAAAKAAWNDICVDLEKLGVLSPVHRLALQAYVSNFLKWQEAEADILENGHTLSGSRDRTIRNPAIIAARDYWDRHVRILCEFGLTPSSQSRVQTIDPAAAPGSKIAAFKARIAG